MSADLLLGVGRGLVVGAIGYLFFLGLVAILAPQAARKFLAAFATTPFLNGLEAILRGLAGVGFVLAADDFPSPDLWAIAGWFLMISAGAIALLYPLHRAFARLVVPPVLAHVRLYGAMSLALGAFVLTAWVLL